jgi:hypothetical protein
LTIDRKSAIDITACCLELSKVEQGRLSELLNIEKSGKCPFCFLILPHSEARQTLPEQGERRSWINLQCRLTDIMAFLELPFLEQSHPQVAQRRDGCRRVP